jgi:hypothetical protein
MNPTDFRAIDVIAGGRLKIDQKARECPVVQTRVSDAAMPRNLMINSILICRKESCSKVYFAFLSYLMNPNVLIHDALKRIRVRRIRKSANSMWPAFGDYLSSGIDTKFN